MRYVEAPIDIAYTEYSMAKGQSGLNAVTSSSTCCSRGRATPHDHQAPLLSGLCVAAMLAYRGTRSARALAFRRIGLLLVLGAAGIGIVFPGSSRPWQTRSESVAAPILCSTSWSCLSLFIWVGVYRRLHDLEARFVSLAGTWPSHKMGLRQMGLSKRASSDDA